MTTLVVLTLDTRSAKKVYVNPAHIASIYTAQLGEGTRSVTLVSMSNGATIEVKEEAIGVARRVQKALGGETEGDGIH